MKVDVYRNLHKKCMSVKSRETGSKYHPAYGIVIIHSTEMLLHDCQFVVREKGRQKVILSKRKNVHAFVRGVLKSGNWCSIPSAGLVNPATGRTYDFRDLTLDKWVEVTYNPYMFETFVVRSTGQPIMKAEKVLIIDSKVYARDGL